MNALCMLRPISLGVVMTAALVACGDSGNQQVAGGGVTGTGISYGTVTGFGSVFVNGVKYNTDTTTVTLDDNPGTEADLRVGMVVKVDGIVNDDGVSGAATAITYDDILEGTVDTKPDLATNTFVVMGQTVIFDNLTVFEDKTVDPSTIGTFMVEASKIAVGNVVEVSGWVDHTGAIRASRIERKANSFIENGVNELEIKGTIASLNGADNTFKIGGLIIYYGAPTLIEGTLVNGARVEVKSRQALSSGVMTASQVEVEGLPLGTVVSGRVEIEGFVTSGSAADFTLLGMQVKTTSSTVYENGVAADIAPGVKLEVKGRMGADGVFTATIVSFRQPNNIKIEAVVDTVDPSTGIVTVLGIPVQVTTASQLEDDRDKLRPFALANLNPGVDFVEIRGYLKSGGVIAARLERDDLDPDVILQGPVSAKDEVAFSTLTILGVTVNTSTSTCYRSISSSSSCSFGSTARADFYDAIKNSGTYVKAKGTLNSGAIDATEVAIEN